MRERERERERMSLNDGSSMDYVDPFMCMMMELTWSGCIKIIRTIT